MTAELSASPTSLSDLHDLLVNLIRTALAPEAPEHGTWESRVLVAQARISRGGPIPSLDQARLDALWTRAIRDAENDPAVQRDETVNPTLPMICPISIADLVTAAFDRDSLVQQIRDTASFG